MGLCWSLVRKYLLDVSHVPLGMKGAHDPHVEWSVTTMKCGDRGTTRPSETYNDLRRETVYLCVGSNPTPGATYFLL